MENTKQIKFIKIIIVLYLLIYTVISIFYIEKYPLYYDDETMFSEPSWQYLKEGRFTTKVYPEGFSFESSNVAYGRIFYFFNSMVFKFFGLGIFQIRLQSMIAGIISILLVYFISKELFNTTIAILSALFLSFSHHFIMISHIARPDMTVAMSILLTMYFFLLAKRKKSLLLYFFAGLFSTLSVDIHPSGLNATLVLITLTLYFIKELNIKIFISMITGMISGGIWWLFIHILISPAAFFNQMGSFWFSLYKLHPAFYYIFSDPLKFIMNEFGRYRDFFWLGRYHRNMYLLFLLIFSIFAYLKNRGKQTQLIIFSLITCMLSFLFIMPNKSNFYLIHIYPFLVILITKFLYDLIKTPVLIKKIAGIGFSVILSVMLFAEVGYKLYKYREVDYYSFVNKLKKYVPQNSTVIGKPAYWLGFVNQPYFVSYNFHHLVFGNKQVKKLLGANFKEVVLKNKTEYIIDDEGTFWFLKQNQEYPADISLFYDKHCSLITVIKDKFFGSGDYAFISRPESVTKIYKVIALP